MFSVKVRFQLNTILELLQTPIEINRKLTLKEDDLEIKIHLYQKIIGKLLYLAHTRPDISYSVNMLSQFMHNPRRTHYQVAL